MYSIRSVVVLESSWYSRADEEEELHITSGRTAPEIRRSKTKLPWAIICPWAAVVLDDDMCWGDYEIGIMRSSIVFIGSLSALPPSDFRFFLGCPRIRLESQVASKSRIQPFVQSWKIATTP
jgi:hypothetical protein